ncbi:MAG: hypothetical protein HY327_09500 [Chloroflexi bacterium]|nr:hypothetical protein [Chloroflexota bacterium]
MNSLESANNQLEIARQRLWQHWEDARAVWNDSVRWDFEKEYWTPLEHQAQATQREMERLAQLIAQVQRNIK